MRAIRCHELIGPDALRLDDIPEPEADGRILVDVEAAGVSFADLLVSQGLYQVRSEPPFVPGMEIAGRVRSAPAGSGFSAGDRVCGSAAGAFAQVTAATPDRLFTLPDQLSFRQGAALTVNYQTAMFALHHRAGFREGETALVLGAAGGTGTSAIQVLRGLGASRIVGLVSSDDKARIAIEAGADEALLISDDWKDRARDLTGGSGYDLVYDPVGGDLFLDGVRSLATGGRLLVIGFAGGSIPELRINRLLLNNVGIVGAAWGEAVRRDPTLPPRIHARLVPLIEAGFVRPPIGAVFPLEQVADAYRLFAERKATGKVVVQIGQEE
ncbi:MAG: NADPH:quinone oxidoreductase family protein [Thermoanaerobaculia bacterium]|nr:NADPH:quinone oxidoreductase family protein [Thermoanaerobaculia bacterium]